MHTITLSNAQGRALHQYTLAGGQTHEPSLAGLPNGPYLLAGQAAGGSSRFTLRLLKE
ncbi:hypothetical protein GCM10023185_44460 [Hymenobacter saemangeumensis]|uniref:T9SS type A sorting domain-containing protein n=1 Tax=Hymenobacter saemangeumensis TaxID=1084522 RepID=A0ABP8IT09_9BACT